jgi:AcrR family transcriptional regulator
MHGLATRVRRPASAARKLSRKRPSQRRSRDTVDVILDATARVLAKRGYLGTNTNLVADVAGVSVGSIYQYFPNKEALVAAVHDRHSEEMHALIQRVIDNASGSSLRNGIASLVSALLDAHQQNAALHAVLEREFPLYDNRNGNDGEQEMLRLIEGYLQGHAATIAVKNLSVAAHFVFETMVSLVHATIVEPRPNVKLSDIELEIVAAVMGYLVVPRPLRAM